MNTEEVLKYLIDNNSYVESSLVDGFINPLRIKYLPLDVLEYCVINKKVQEKIMTLGDNELIVLSNIINYAKSLNQDWIPLAANFIHFLENGCYRKLVNDIKREGVLLELISSLLFFTNNSQNYFHIDSLEDLKNIDNIRNLKLREISNTNDPNSILLVKYGISYDKAYNYYKRYGKDVIKLNDTIEKSFLLDIKDIIEGKGTIKELCDDYNFLNNIDSRLRNSFANIYNKCLYNIKEENYLTSINYNKKSIPLYDAGVNFMMAIYSYGVGSDLDRPINYKDDWLRPRVSVDYMCNSIINSLNMKISIKHCVFGFASFQANDLALLSANDLGTGNIYGDVNVTNPYYSDKLIADVEFRVPDELIKNTRLTNNEVYRVRRRNNNGKLKKILPDYIVYFKKDDYFSDDKIWLESIRAADNFNIPIVLVDCEKCLIDSIKRIDDKMQEFECCYDNITSVLDVIEMIYSLRSGYRIANNLLDKYLNLEKVYSYVYRIIKHFEKMAELTPRIAIQGINNILEVLDMEYDKILKSPYWFSYAKKQGYNIDKPIGLIDYLNNLKKKIEEELKQNEKENILN